MTNLGNDSLMSMTVPQVVLLKSATAALLFLCSMIHITEPNKWPNTELTWGFVNTSFDAAAAIRKRFSSF